MDDFKFENPTRFYFGNKQLMRLADELAGRKTVMLAYGGSSIKETGLFDRIVKLVAGVEARVVEFGGIMPNPTWAKVEEGAALANAEDVDFILGVGGGSVMDCAKAISLAARQDRAWKRHWVRDEPILVDPIPCGFVVTCAGSGSEGNGCALITNEKTHVKTGHDYPELRPRFAILEPKTTFDVPLEQTIAGAYETLSRLMETYFSTAIGKNLLADDLLETAMRSVMRSLEAVIEEPNDYAARANLLWASSLAQNGMLKCGKEGIYQVQMIARQVSAYTDCMPGFALAAIQAQYYWFVKVTSALMTLQLKRFAVNMFGIDPHGKTDIAVAIEGIDALQAWTKSVGAFRPLPELGVTMELIPKIAKSAKIIPMKYCKLTSDDIEILLEQCMQLK